MLADNTGSKVRFELSDGCQPRAPVAKRQIQSLCTQVQKAKQSTCLNMRLQDSGLYETRLTPSKLPVDMLPAATMQDIVCGAAMISYESRIILAVLLAYAVLYLYGSPWLPSGWDEGSIRFEAQE
jgi:hypothetical protein